MTWKRNRTIGRRLATTSKPPLLNMQTNKTLPDQAEQITAAGKPTAIMQAALTVESHSGPIPHPHLLAQYDAVVPGAAERIIAMAERQQAHRHSLEASDLQGNIGYAKRGQWMAYTLTSASFVIGVYLATNGAQALAGVLFGTVILGLVASFLASKSAVSSSNTSPKKKPRPSGDKKN